jgi:NmrA-like family
MIYIRSVFVSKTYLATSCRDASRKAKVNNENVQREVHEKSIQLRMMEFIPPSILILGAGELGSAIISAIIAHPAYSPDTTKLSVLLRHSSASTLPGESVNIVRHDLGDSSESALATVFGKFHTVICCTGFAGGTGTQVKITKAAIQAGVKRYFPWQFGVDYDAIGKNSAQDLWDEQLAVRNLLRSQSKVEWVIVSTGMFTSFLFEPSFGVVNLEQNTVRPLGSESNRVTVTSPQDIGRVVAELVLVDTDVQGIVYTAGDTISYGQLIAAVEKVSGRIPSVLPGDVSTLQKELGEDPSNTLKKYRVAFAKETGVSWDAEQTYNARKNMHMESVADYIAKIAEG